MNQNISPELNELDVLAHKIAADFGKKPRENPRFSESDTYLRLTEEQTMLTFKGVADWIIYYSERRKGREGKYYWTDIEYRRESSGIMYKDRRSDGDPEEPGPLGMLHALHIMENMIDSLQDQARIEF